MTSQATAVRGMPKAPSTLQQWFPAAVWIRQCGS